MRQYQVGDYIWSLRNTIEQVTKVLGTGQDQMIYYVDPKDGGNTWCSPDNLKERNHRLGPVPTKAQDVATYTGGSSDYYQVQITKTTTPDRPAYIAECNDIIEALGMNFAEGNAFKALWRRAAQRTLGKRKAGAKDDGLYDAEKVEFFGARLVAQSKGNE